MNDLIEAARAASDHAYAPYSNYPVGAAIRLSDGAIVTGANVENASYGLSLCAEAVAIAKAANEGRLADIVEIAVIAGTQGVTPCGRCRQMLNEAAVLGDRDIVVTVGQSSVPLSDLLPQAFGPKDLS